MEEVVLISVSGGGFWLREITCVSFKVRCMFGDWWDWRKRIVFTSVLGGPGLSIHHYIVCKAFFVFWFEQKTYNGRLPVFRLLFGRESGT